MELLERYLQAVRFWLPRKQQDDILEELRDDIRSRVEDKEAALGRPLGDDEMAALLRQTGHPMRVAGRYQPQESLIGPALFPLYKFVLKIIAICYLTPWVLVWIGMVALSPSYRAGHPGMALLGTWTSFWNVTLALFGAITVFFVLLERSQARLGYFEKWDPRKLPQVKRPRQRVSRVESIFGLVFSAFFVVWWLTLPNLGHILFEPMGGVLALNPGLRNYHLLPLVPTLVLMLQQCINLFRPQWTWLRAVFMLASDVMTLAIIGAIASRYPYLHLAEGAKDAAQYARALPILNQLIAWSLMATALGIAIAAIVHLVQTVREFRRLRGERPQQAHMQISQMM
jgi:hypothetical protein